MDWTPNVPDLFGFGSSTPEPGYASLREVNLAALEAAVTEWERVRDDLEGLSGRARHDLVGGAHRSGWRGENARVTVDFVDRTAEKFRFAHEQATAVHSLLRALHDDLLSGRNALRALESTAHDQGVQIDAAGVVHPAAQPSLTLPVIYTLDAAPLGESGVDAMTVQAMQNTQADIRRIVDTATEADRLAARSLDLLAQADDGAHFGPSGYTAAEEFHHALVMSDARHFVDLAGQEELSASDLHRMRQFLDDHADDPPFGAHVIDTVGMAEYLRLADRMDQSATGLNSGTQLATDLRQGMGTTLSTVMTPPPELAGVSTRDPEFTQWLGTRDGRAYQQRLDALQEAGAARLGDGPSWLQEDRRYGYDVALDLLGASETPVNEHFFAQTADHLMALEKENPRIWAADRFPNEPAGMAEWTPVDPWDPENDALDRLLGIGAGSNPDAVAAYFDPAAGHDDRLQYFIGGADSPAGFTDHRHVYTDEIDSTLKRLASTTPPGPASCRPSKPRPPASPPAKPPSAHANTPRRTSTWPRRYGRRSRTNTPASRT